MSKIQIKIRLDGATPGLAEHKLSLNAFGPMLVELGKGVRGTASAIISNAVGPEHGTKGGKLKKRAKDLDIVLVTIEEGCAYPEFEVLDTPVEPINGDMFENLKERAATFLFEGLKEEAKGQATSHWARKILEEFPSTTSIGEFYLYQDGVLLDEFSYENPKEEDEDKDDIPRLQTFMVEVDAIGLRDGNEWVELRFPDDETTTLRCDATSKVISRVLALRTEATISAQVLLTPGKKRKARLLNVKRVGDSFVRMNKEEAGQLVRQQWSEVYRYLKAAD